MAEHVEGDWKQFVFKILKPEDYTKILTHLRNTFYREEALCKLSQLGELEFDQVDQVVLMYLKQNDELSFYAEDKESGKVAGVRITYKKSCLPNNELDEPPADQASEKIQRILRFLAIVNKENEIGEHYGIDYYADFLMASVDPEFQQLGLAGEMYSRSLALLRAKGYPACKSMFSSPYTRRAVTKLGFEELARLKFVDFKNEEGEPEFPNADPESFSASMALKLV